VTEIQQNRWDQLVRRAAGIVGGGSQVNDTLNELFPVIDVERVPIELLALMGTGVAWGQVSSPAVAAQVARAQLFNPADSGKIIAVTSVFYRSATVMDMFFGVLQVALANKSAVPRYRDSRFGTTLTPVAELRTDDNAAATPASFRTGTTAVGFDELRDDNGIAVLSPGLGLVCSGSAVNTEMRVSFLWRERVAEPSELNL